jgi:alkylated DNA repair dioxygenase AlkB
VLVQASLFDRGAPAPTGAVAHRTDLDHLCWVVHASGWLAGADDLLVELDDRLNWRPGRRQMWGEWVDEPRLHFGGRPGSIDAHPAIRTAGDAVSARYDDDLSTMFANYYRDGRDGVAWHADRIGRTEIDPLVAIVSLGGPRTFRLRPMGGGPSRSVLLHSGDLLVMGGSCQHRWQHCIPRQHGAGGRISLTFRRGGELGG